MINKVIRTSKNNIQYLVAATIKRFCSASERLECGDTPEKAKSRRAKVL